VCLEQDACAVVAALARETISWLIPSMEDYLFR